MESSKKKKKGKGKKNRQNQEKESNQGDQRSRQSVSSSAHGSNQGQQESRQSVGSSAAQVNPPAQAGSDPSAKPANAAASATTTAAVAREEAARGVVGGPGARGGAGGISGPTGWAQQDGQKESFPAEAAASAVGGRVNFTAGRADEKGQAADQGRARATTAAAGRRTGGGRGGGGGEGGGPRLRAGDRYSSPAPPPYDTLSDDDRLNRDDAAEAGQSRRRANRRNDVAMAGAMAEVEAEAEGGGDGEETSDATSPIRVKSAGSGVEDGGGIAAGGDLDLDLAGVEISTPRDVARLLPTGAAAVAPPAPAWQRDGGGGGGGAERAGLPPPASRPSSGDPHLDTLLHGPHLVRYLASRVDDLSAELAHLKGGGGGGKEGGGGGKEAGGGGKAVDGRSTRGDSSLWANGGGNLEEEGSGNSVVGTIVGGSATREGWVNERVVGGGGGGGREGGAGVGGNEREVRRARRPARRVGGGSLAAKVASDAAAADSSPDEAALGGGGRLATEAAAALGGGGRKGSGSSSSKSELLEDIVVKLRHQLLISDVEREGKSHSTLREHQEPVLKRRAESMEGGNLVSLENLSREIEAEMEGEGEGEGAEEMRGRRERDNSRGWGSQAQQRTVSMGGGEGEEDRAQSLEEGGDRNEGVDGNKEVGGMKMTAIARMTLAQNLAMARMTQNRVMGEEEEEGVEERSETAASEAFREQGDWNGSGGEMEDMVENLRDKLDMERESTIELRQQLFNLERENERRKEELEDMVETLRQQVEKERGNTRTLRGNVLRLEEERGRLLAMQSELETASQAVEKERDLAIKDLNQRIEKEKEIARDLRDQLRTLEQDLASRELAGESREAETLQLREENRSLSMEVAAWRLKVDQLQLEKAQLANKLSVVQSGVEVSVQPRDMQPKYSFGLGGRARDPIAEAAALSEESRLQKEAAAATIQKLVLENDSLMAKVNEQSLVLNQLRQENNELSAALDKGHDGQTPMDDGLLRTAGGDDDDNIFRHQPRASPTDVEPYAVAHQQGAPASHFDPAPVLPSPAVSYGNFARGLDELHRGERLASYRSAEAYLGQQPDYSDYSSRSHHGVTSAEVAPPAQLSNASIYTEGGVRLLQSRAQDVQHFPAFPLSDQSDEVSSTVQEMLCENGYGQLEAQRHGQSRIDSGRLPMAELAPVPEDDARETEGQRLDDSNQVRREVDRGEEEPKSAKLVGFTDSPLTGAPFRFVSFLARYVTGADLIK